MTTFVLATANPHKAAEMTAILGALGIAVQPRPENVPDVPETSATLEGNALLKARHAAAAGASVGLPGVAALADDSGLEVDALGGAPGIYSARYAGSGAEDSANNVKLLDALKRTPPDQRRARYRCALVFVRSALDSAPLIAEGVWEGLILDEPRGSGGFGYDPYFFLAELGLTAAELDATTKNRLSHRGIAMRALRDRLAAGA